MDRSERLPQGEYESNDRAISADRVLHFLDEMQAEEIFSNDQRKMEFIRHTDFSEFKQLLIRLNGLIRGEDIREFDGEHVAIAAKIQIFPIGVPPAHKDKEPLLQETWSAAQSMDDVDDVALMLSTVACEVHPFNDGNGRLSRLLYYLLHEDYRGELNPKEYLTKLLGDEGRGTLRMGILEIPVEFEALVTQDFTGIELAKPAVAKDPNQPSRLMPKGWSRGSESQPELGNPNLSPEDERVLSEIIEGWERFPVVYKYLAGAGKLRNTYIQPHLAGDGSTDFSMLLWDEIYPDLTHEDAVGIKREYLGFKKFRIQKMIDMFVHPDNYRMPDGSTMKDKVAEGVASWELDK